MNIFQKARKVLIGLSIVFFSFQWLLRHKKIILFAGLAGTVKALWPFSISYVTGNQFVVGSFLIKLLQAIVFSGIFFYVGDVQEDIMPPFRGVIKKTLRSLPILCAWVIASTFVKGADFMRFGIHRFLVNVVGSETGFVLLALEDVVRIFFTLLVTLFIPVLISGEYSVAQWFVQPFRTIITFPGMILGVFIGIFAVDFVAGFFDGLVLHVSISFLDILLRRPFDAVAIPPQFGMAYAWMDVFLFKATFFSGEAVLAASTYKTFKGESIFDFEHESIFKSLLLVIIGFVLISFLKVSVPFVFALFFV